MTPLAPRSSCVLRAAPGLLVFVLALGAARVSAQEPAPSGGVAAPTSGPSAEATPEQIREARALFNLAHAHYDAGRFAEAAVELERALALAPRPQLYFDLHLAYREMGDAERSAGALRHYLAEYDAMDPEQRVTLERRLAALDRTLAEHASGQEPTPTTTDEDTHATDEALRAESSAVEAPPSSSPSELIDRGDEGLPLTPGVVALTAGALALVGAAIAGGVSLSTMASRDAMCTAGASGTECLASVPQEALLHDFEAQRDVAWGLFGGGLAVAVAGAVLVGIAATDDRAPGTSGTPGVSAASLVCSDVGCAASVSGSY
ncbi:MAG: tetratricopeptide repeat protein [Sandaracinaceae bacterium]|nr:tetratricopeptide repeat protein [Sandaracinaceae bacterium]